MEKRLVICDTNIFIEFYKGNKEVIKNLHKIGVKNITLSSVTVGELIYGAFDKSELISIRKNISQLNILPINEKCQNFNFI